MKSIPSFDFVVEDSPECHQSLKYWNQRSKDVSVNAIKSLFCNFVWEGMMMGLA